MGLHFLARGVGTTVAETEKFLIELANLHESPAAAGRIIKRFPGFFPDCIGDLDGLSQMIGVDASTYNLAVLQDHFVIWLHFHTKMIWDFRQEVDWNIFLFRLRLAEFYNWALFDHLNKQQHETGEAFGRLAFDLGPPHPDRREQIDFAMEYLWRNLDRAKHCQWDACPAPYFFAKKKGQEYCSTTCSGHAQKQQKRRWWAEHGKQRRKERKKK